MRQDSAWVCPGGGGKLFRINTNFVSNLRTPQQMCDPRVCSAATADGLVLVASLPIPPCNFPGLDGDDLPPVRLMGWETTGTAPTRTMAFTPAVLPCDRMARYYTTLLELVSWYSKSSGRLLFLHGLLSRRPSKTTATTSLRKLDKFIRGREASEEAKQDYRRLVHANTRELFDPFCRGRRIHLLVECPCHRPTDCPHADLTSKGITTSVAQLNFIRWAHETNLATAFLASVQANDAHRPTRAQVQRCVSKVVVLARRSPSPNARRQASSPGAWDKFLAMAAQVAANQ